MKDTDDRAKAVRSDGMADAMPLQAIERYQAFMQRQAPANAHEWLQVDAYQASIQQLNPSMVGRVYELTVGVFWPHREHDLELLLRLGAGYIALDEIGRPLGSAMYFRYGDDFAMCGMMVTTPRLQSHGTGARLLRRVMADCAGCDLRLSATRSGYKLYESAGFVPVGPIRQHQGIAREIPAPEAVAELSVRPCEAADLHAVHALDMHAYGAGRGDLLAALLDHSAVTVAERNGALVGFAMLRDFGKGRVIGPVVAEGDTVAMHLCAGFIQAHRGRFLRLDTPIDSERFSAFLCAAGLGVYDTVTEMRLGKMRRALNGPLVYGLAAQTLG